MHFGIKDDTHIWTSDLSTGAITHHTDGVETYKVKYEKLQYFKLINNSQFPKTS